jgi:hypothetical protein
VKTRVFAILLAVATLVAVALVGARARVALSHPLPPPPPVRTFPREYAGIVDYNLVGFDRACRCTPNIAAQYIHIGGSISMGGVRSLLVNGAVPLLELEPYGISFAQINSGAENKWLTSYAQAVASLHAPVVMSFAPEANGNWYTWGYPHVPPLVFVSAWQHVVSVFRNADPSVDVRWAWIMNVNFQGSENIAALWPGSGYVNILGLDGYLTTPATFQEFFGPTIVSMRSLSSDPLLITETAASPVVGKLRALREIISGVAQYGLAGFIWFDVRQTGSVTRQDWRLEDEPAAMALYSSDVNRVRSARP